MHSVNSSDSDFGIQKDCIVRFTLMIFFIYSNHTLARMNKIPILLLPFGGYITGRISGNFGNNTLIPYYQFFQFFKSSLKG